MSGEGDAVAPLDTAVTPFPGVAWVARRPVGVVGQLSLLTTHGIGTRLRKARADEIAGQLRSHQRWLSHSKSIKMDDLRAMRLKVTDYRGEGEHRNAREPDLPVLGVGRGPDDAARYPPGPNRGGTGQVRPLRTPG